MAVIEATIFQVYPDYHPTVGISDQPKVTKTCQLKRVLQAGCNCCKKYNNSKKQTFKALILEMNKDSTNRRFWISKYCCVNISK